MKDTESGLNAPKVDDLRMVVANAYYSNKVLIISGAPGIGKTEITKALYEEMGLKSYTAEPQLWGGIAAGLPVLVKADDTNEIITQKVDNLLKEKYKNKVPENIDSLRESMIDFYSNKDNNNLRSKEELTLSKVKWLEDAIRDGVNVIIFDDMDKVSPNEAAMFYRLFTDRYLGNNKVPDDLRFICLGNYNVKSTGVDGILPSTIVNRTGVIEYEFDSDKWLEWAMTAKYPNNNRKVDLKTWAFLKAYPMYISSFEDTPQRVFASPRSWVNACDQLNSRVNKQEMIKLFGEPSLEDIRTIVNQYVGKKIANEYATVYEILDRSVEDILKSKPEDLQEQVLFSVILSTNTNSQNIDKILPYIKENIESPDVVGMFAIGVKDTIFSKKSPDTKLITKIVQYFDKDPKVKKYYEKIYSNEIDAQMSK